MGVRLASFLVLAAIMSVVYFVAVANRVRNIVDEAIQDFRVYRAREQASMLGRAMGTAIASLVPLGILLSLIAGVLLLDVWTWWLRLVLAVAILIVYYLLASLVQAILILILMFPAAKIAEVILRPWIRQ